MRFRENKIPFRFQLFVEKEIWPKLKPLHEGYKIKDKKETAAQILHNLISAGLTNKVVADTRDVNTEGVRLRIKIWDCLIQKKLCRMCKGSEESGRITLYRATGKLLELREEWELKLFEDLELKRNTEEAIPTNHALVVLHSGKTDWLTGRLLEDENKRKPISIKERIEATCQRDKDDIYKPDKQALENGLNFHRETENLINEINTENLAHTWIAYKESEMDNIIAFRPNVCLRQIHSGRLFRGTRLHSWGNLSGQGMPKEQRQTIQIDGEQSAEVDSHCHAIRMLYHLNRIDEREDVYWPEKVFKHYFSFNNISLDKRKIVRGFVKIATNICLNTPSINSASGAVRKHLKENEHGTFLKDLIYKTEESNINGILQRLIKAHPKKVENNFFTEIGLELMTTDGNIMLCTLEELVVQRHVPALAIHDSLVIRSSDIAIATEIFSKNYCKFTRFKPVLKRVF
ncbi:MAG: hypothetical protein K8R79_08240 [Calditrichales bacterium]|nr:hypothetical protein [Calditrichales bacterium]